MTAPDLTRQLREELLLLTADVDVPPDLATRVVARSRRLRRRRAVATSALAVAAVAGVLGIAWSLTGTGPGTEVVVAGPGTALPGPPATSAPPVTSAPTVTASPAEPGAPAAVALLRFAEDPSPEHFAALPFGPGPVGLGLGASVHRFVPAGELADPSSWILDVEEFNGWAGPFDLLGFLADAQEAGHPVAVTAGPHDHCAAPPVDPPAEGAGLHQVSLQPAGIDGCLEWFALDLYVDDDGRIVVVRLDLWAP